MSPSSPPTSPFADLGGEPGVRALVDRFYDLMDTLPEVRVVRDLHPPDLTTSREKLSLFLIGFFGGPALYVQKYGHPRLRGRHLPFPIADAEADQWMLCMARALQEQVADEGLRARLTETFERTARHMRNRASDSGPGPAGPPLRKT